VGSPEDSVTRGDLFGPTEHRASHALVVSEDDWNDLGIDVVAVPCAPGRGEGSLIRPVIGTLPTAHDAPVPLHARCDLIRAVPREALGERVRCGLYSDWQALIADALGTLIGLGHRLGSRRPSTGPRTGQWWPRQGQVTYGPSYDGERKMVATVTEDDWNVAHDRSLAIRLTSRARGRSRSWYVPLQGGWLATPDVAAYLYSQLDQRGRPPVAAITADQFDVLTSRLVELWGLRPPNPLQYGWFRRGGESVLPPIDPGLQ
jgi:mRNA-degrading endonuclease toxin of MazEF toxin-antitoxin module